LKNAGGNAGNFASRPILILHLNFQFSILNLALPMTTPLDPTLPRLPPRPADAHKGTFGTALIIAGSRGMTGAAALAGMAALRGGAGLVKLAVADSCLETVAGYEPSYMTVPLPDDIDGRISGEAYARIADLARSATVVALGPGMGRSPELDRLVAQLYHEIPVPMLCDADALNALSTNPEVLRQHAGSRILTPHPGEFARLVGHKYPGEEQEMAALELAARCELIVVLKGHRTYVTDGRRHWHNSTGNPGMATGGSGDSLTGLITALGCQGLEPYDAARLGVYLHGLAGDLAAKELGENSLIASDIVRYMPQALKAAGEGQG
jgi:ADP-dependent NAD(P)H-hydrate dehydratase